MATTLTALRSRLSSEILRDPNNRVRPVTTLDSAINEAQKKIWFRLGSMVDDVQSTTSTVSWTQEYDLPSDYGRLITATFAGVELVRTTLKELRKTYSTFTSWTPCWYYIRPWSIWLYPIPNLVGTLLMYYVNVPPTITTSQDTSLPSFMDWAILTCAASLCFWPTNLDKSREYEAKFDTAYNEWFLMMVADENLTF